MGKNVGLGFKLFSGLLPVKKVYKSQHILGFLHPKPSYKNHILLVPKYPIRDLLSLSKNTKYQPYLIDIWRAVQKIVEQYKDFQEGYVLCANGGTRQEVQQVHLHLFTAPKIINDSIVNHVKEKILITGQIEVYKHPNPQWEVHIVIKHKNAMSMNDISENKIEMESILWDIILILPQLNNRFDLVKMGYTIVFQSDHAKHISQNVVFHVIGGKRL